jgi:hypothetical protein
LIDRLDGTALETSFVHPTRGETTVETMLRIIPRHLREHINEIRAAMQR